MADKKTIEIELDGQKYQITASSTPHAATVQIEKVNEQPDCWIILSIDRKGKWSHISTACEENDAEAAIRAARTHNAGVLVWHIKNGEGIEYVPNTQVIEPYYRNQSGKDWLHDYGLLNEPLSIHLKGVRPIAGDIVKFGPIECEIKTVHSSDRYGHEITYNRAGRNYTTTLPVFSWTEVNFHEIL